MTWRSHPRFDGVRRRVLKVFAGKTRYFTRLKPVVFLCGADASKPRERLASYFLRTHRDHLIFYADEVWAEISSLPGLNSLEMEDQLAQLADILVIIVESPGTFAELGAFSLSNQLRSKLLPILNGEFRCQNSFINTGPVRWIDKDSAFAPCIWVDHQRILGCASELDERLKRLPPRKHAHVTKLDSSPKHLLFHVADLITVFGPISLSDIEEYLEVTVGKTLSIQVHNLVALAKATRLIRSFASANGLNYYFRALQDDEMTAFQWRAGASISSLRAQVMACMQTIPEASAVLDEMRKQQ